jgi:cytochrome c
MNASPSLPNIVLLKKSALFALLLIMANACNNKDSATLAPPEENRFTTTVLTQPGDLNEPMAFTFLNNDELLFVERKGGVKSFNVNTRTIRTVATIAVNTMYTNKEGQSRAAEEGLMGVVAHPDYEKNHWIFMLLADPDEPKHVLVRYKYEEGKLNKASGKTVLEYPVQREACCHTGGGMVFDKEGNLFLTVGNNTVNPPQGTSNLDERPDHENSDDQRTAGNSNDLRGKILRIHPEDDGSYTIPDGNLFPPGTPKTRPEIYTMGHRNPWRISIDNETGYIYWGEVGPDAPEDLDQGPRGYDEFNQAKGTGFFGWPYFIGDNKPYADYDYETDSIYGYFDVNNPVNTSPNNTGITKLPPPQNAFFWYPYSYSDEFPLLGSAGRSATGGPVFRLDDFPESDKRFPAYYEGKWFMTEFMRGWIMVVTMDENGDYVNMEPFLPNENFSSAIDMQFSPDGDLYVLEYGSAWFRGNENAQIKRIQYNAGNRPPILQASADTKAGAVPLTVRFSSEGTMDYDGDQLSYEWQLRSDHGFSETLKGPHPEITLTDPGVYAVKLVVTDGHGNDNEQQFEVTAGNAPPEVDLKITQGNQTFFFPGNELTYSVGVSDLEDGNLTDGISPEEVAINFDYVPEGFDPIEIAQNHRSSEEWVTYSRGKALIDNSDCLSCHRIDVKSIGPSYMEVATKYDRDQEGQALIAQRIINGSVGVWGEHAMSAHPDISPEEATSIVNYIMGLNDPQPLNTRLPLEGSFITSVPVKENGKGSYLLRVAYTDKGAANAKSISSEKIVALRNPVLDPEQFDEASGIQILTTPSRSLKISKSGGWLHFGKVDLTGIDEIGIIAEASPRTGDAGGIIELHLEGHDGPLAAVTERVDPIEYDIRNEVQKLREEWEKGGKKGPRPGFQEVRQKFQRTYALDVSGINDFTELYLVFKNPGAKTGQMLMQVNEISFRKKSAAL